MTLDFSADQVNPFNSATLYFVSPVSKKQAIFANRGQITSATLPNYANHDETLTHDSSSFKRTVSAIILKGERVLDVH